MNCPKCGGENIKDSTFCVKCGVNLKELGATSENVVMQANNQKFEEAKKTALNYFKYAKDVLLKPYETFKSKEEELKDTKNSLIFSGIVSVVMMLVTLLTSMISSIFVKEISMKTFEYHTVIKFSGLGNLNYLTLIGRNLLIYAGIIAVIALIYYIISLMFKKDVNFIKLLSISSTSIIPFIALGMVLAPILNIIWNPLSLIAKILGLVYSTLIFIKLVKEEINFDSKDLEIKFNLICLTILTTICYYVYTKLFIVTVNSGLNDLLNNIKW